MVASASSSVLIRLVILSSQLESGEFLAANARTCSRSSRSRRSTSLGCSCWMTKREYVSEPKWLALHDPVE